MDENDKEDMVQASKLRKRERTEKEERGKGKGERGKGKLWKNQQIWRMKWVFTQGPKGTHKGPTVSNSKIVG